jgi:hypothetical protein
VSTLLPDMGKRALPSLLTAGDHAVSAASNGVIAVIVARNFGAYELGYFTLSYATYLIANAVNRSLVSEPLLASDGRPDKTTLASASSAGLYFSILVALPMMAGAALLGNPVLMAFAVGLPILSLHDTRRLFAFRRGRPQDALRLDLPWLAVTGALWPLGAHLTVAQLTWYWILGSLLGLVAGGAFPRIVSPAKALTWWRADAKNLAVALFSEGVIFHLASHGTIFVVSALAGVSELGRLRTAQLLMTPVLMLPAILALMSTPHLADSNPREHWPIAAQWARVAAISMVLISLVWGTVAFLMQGLIFPQDLAIPPLFILLLAGQAVVAIAAVPLSSFARVARRRRAILVSRTVSVATGFSLLVMLTLLAGLTGSLTALLVQAFMYVAVITILLRPRQRDGHELG